MLHSMRQLVRQLSSGREYMRNLLVTGGAGFIGSNFVHYMLERHPDYQITVLDKLTYAGNTENFRGLSGNPRFSFVQGDVAVDDVVDALVEDADAVVNFAAETH